MRWYRNNNSIITLSDEELNKKFAWKRKCFKNPFFGFEDELELREFKVLLDSYIYGKVEDQIESPVVESDFKNVDLFFFFNLKHKLYEASVRRILMRDIKEYQLSFLTKKSLKRAMDANIFIKMYSLAVKKQKQKSDLYIADNINTLAKFDKTNMIDSYFSTGELSIDDLLKDESTLEYFENFISPVKFLNENFGFNDVFEEHVETDKKKHIFLSKEYSFWNLNKKIVSEIKQTLEEPLEEIISFIFEDSQVKILKDSDIRNMVFWSERNIPFFFLNRNTGMVDYDF